MADTKELKADSVDELEKGVKPESSKKPIAEVKETVKQPKQKRAKLSTLSESEQIQIHVQRNTHAVQKASKEEKKDLYSNEHIFVEEGDEAYLETETTKRKEEWIELVASAKEDRILNGIVTSITTIATTLEEDDPDYIPEYMAKVKYKTGQFDINIPSYAFYDYELNQKANKNGAEIIRRNMLRRLGSEVSFAVRYVEEATGTVYADRLTALSKKGVGNYVGQGGRRAKIIPGEQVLAKVIAVARDAITVEAGGAEIDIPLPEIGWVYTTDARLFDGIHFAEDYSVGARVPVKILTAEPYKVKKLNTTYTLIKATGSIRQTKKNPREENFKKFKLHDMFSGYVTGVTEDGIYINIEDKIDCRCNFPKKDNQPIPSLGDRVRVEVTLLDTEKMFVFGTLLN